MVISNYFALLVLIGYFQILSAALPVKIPQLSGNSSEQCNLEFTQEQASTSAIYNAITTLLSSNKKSPVTASVTNNIFPDTTYHISSILI